MTRCLGVEIHNEGQKTMGALHVPDSLCVAALTKDDEKKEIHGNGDIG